ncbi:MAG TPA: AI-2E family transporter [Solirubrobacter sp.]|nr:AI-2E family transporter [Solirubrobacter sp.]
MRTRRRVIREQETDGQSTEFVELAPGELSGIFSAPAWLRDLGVMSWLLVGVTVLVAGTIWLLSLTNTIVIPVVTASIIAAVLSPVVGALERRRLPRAAATALVFVGVIVLGVLVAWLILGGIASQAPELERALKSAADKAKSAVQDAGLSSSQAQEARDSVSSALSGAFKHLLHGVSSGIEALASIAIFLSFMALSLFFLLKDGPLIRGWLERHMGVPPTVGRTISTRVLGSLRGYFVGVTAVAAFNAIVIGLGALVLDVPHAGSIAAVNFVAAYIPYLGAWSAGAFTVLIALGSQGTTTALIMIVIVLLANGMLQQLIQPIAFGAALGIHPLAVLIVTIAGGALFGMIGLVLAAPLTSAATHISADLARARAKEPTPAAA